MSDFCPLMCKWTQVRSKNYLTKSNFLAKIYVQMALHRCCSKSEVMLTVLNCIYLLLWWVNFERSCGSKKHVLFLLPQLNWKGRSDLTLKAQKTNKTFWAISSDIYWKRTFSNEGLITSRFRIFLKLLASRWHEVYSFWGIWGKIKILYFYQFLFCLAGWKFST